MWACIEGLTQDLVLLSESKQESTSLPRGEGDHTIADDMPRESWDTYHSDIRYPLEVHHIVQSAEYSKQPPYLELSTNSHSSSNNTQDIAR